MAEYQQDNWESKDGMEDVKKFLGRIRKNWFWIAGALVIALAAAFLMNRYLFKSVYVINASFITKKFDEKSNAGQLSGLIETDAFRQNIEVYQEIPLLKSEDKIRETLRRVTFDVSYFAEGRLKTTEKSV